MLYHVLIPHYEHTVARNVDKPFEIYIMGKIIIEQYFILLNFCFLILLATS